MALNKTVRNAIADSAVSTTQIADDSLTADDFASSSVSATKTA